MRRLIFLLLIVKVNSLYYLLNNDSNWKNGNVDSIVNYSDVYEFKFTVLESSTYQCHNIRSYEFFNFFSRRTLTCFDFTQNNETTVYFMNSNKYDKYGYLTVNALNVYSSSLNDATAIQVSLDCLRINSCHDLSSCNINYDLGAIDSLQVVISFIFIELAFTITLLVYFLFYYLKDVYFIVRLYYIIPFYLILTVALLSIGYLSSYYIALSTSDKYLSLICVVIFKICYFFVLVSSFVFVNMYIGDCVISSNKACKTLYSSNTKRDKRLKEQIELLNDNESKSINRDKYSLLNEYLS